MKNVKEDYRGKGLGKRLYKDALRIARKMGFNKIVVVFPNNQI